MYALRVLDSSSVPAARGGVCAKSHSPTPRGGREQEVSCSLCSVSAPFGVRSLVWFLLHQVGSCRVVCPRVGSKFKILSREALNPSPRQDCIRYSPSTTGGIHVWAIGQLRLAKKVNAWRLLGNKAVEMPHSVPV